MAKGAIQLRIVRGNTEFPVVNAIATIKQTNTENANKNEYKAISDGSGYTEVVEVEAPELILSQSPSTVRPYSTYDIKVIAEGYHDFQVIGAQVFPNILGIQYARLNPKGDQSEYENQIIIPDHLLFGEYPEKKPEEPIKLLPIPVGGIMFKTPSIPYHIVVHLGSPDDDNAKNIRIRYIDYIKTVCGGIIYPTWTEGVIRTSIYCVVSFVLNRIFTEWYRRQGKDFDITNDPIYDQEFFLGRTISSNISEIVNGIFNTYVVKQRKIQPFLAQYCDGIKVIRKGWLLLWESKFLSDEGLNPLEILRKYYGADIALERTQKIEGILEQYPGSPLVIGSTGNSVRIVQEYINRISNVFTPIPKVIVNGNYDLETAEAVKEYQKFFKSNQTGIVDFATWYSLSRLYVQISQAFDRGNNKMEFALDGKFTPPVTDKNEEYIPVIYYPNS